MICYCCDTEMEIARKVKLRPYRMLTDPPGSPDSAAYRSYTNDMTFRWAFICSSCYRTLDNLQGMAEIGSKSFNLAGASRADKAAVVDEAKYHAFQRKEAAKMGMAIPDDV
jgi:hypothetical protein